MKNTFLMLQPFISKIDNNYKEKDFITPVQYKAYEIRNKEFIRYIPNGCEDIIFIFNIEETGHHIIFTNDICNDINTYGHEVFGIRLRPGYTIDPDVDLNELAEMIRSLDSFEARIKYTRNIIKDIVLKRITHPVVANMLSEISESKGIVPVNEIYSKQKYSVRHINRLFIEEIKTGVKDYARYTRFQNALILLMKDPYETALKYLEPLNYSDQAHYQREFRKFMGMSPKKYVNTYLDPEHKRKPGIRP